MPESYSCASGGNIVAGRHSYVPDNAPYKEDARSLFYDAPLDPTLVIKTSGAVTPARATVASPKSDYVWYDKGPHHTYVEKKSLWKWVHQYGDWVDAVGTEQGTVPAATFDATAVTSGEHTYTVDFTAAVQQTQALNTWNAYIVRCATNRQWHSRHGTIPPKLTVTYTDGKVAVLRCLASVRMPSGTSYTFVGRPKIYMWGSNAVLEFEKPTKPVASASLEITVSDHIAGAGTFNFFVCNPPLNTEGPTTGLAANYPFDAGIYSDPDVWFAPSFDDGVGLASIVYGAGVTHNHQYMSEWSPHLFGIGAPNTNKLPYTWQGVDITNKFLHGANPAVPIQFVNSDYEGDGFYPVAPGKGALRVQINGAHAVDGGVVSGGGLTGSDLVAFLPEPVSGLVNGLYTRWDQLWAPYPREAVKDTVMTRLSGQSAKYMLPSGKTGVGPGQWTGPGGNNRAGGGNLGHTSRLVQEACADMDWDAIFIGIHSLDMWFSNYPAGSNDGQVWAGNQGPHGVRLKRGRWYDIETYIGLNDWNELWDTAPTFNGVFKMWIDGVLVINFQGFSYRQGPLNYTDPDDVDPSVFRGYTPTTGTYIPPFRELGHSILLLQDYQGGIEPTQHDQVTFYSNVVSSFSRIGPMSTAPVKPAWAPASGEIKNISYAPGTHPNGVHGGAVIGEISTAYQTWNPEAPGVGPWGGGYGFQTIHAYDGAVFNTDTRQYCNVGAGHSAINPTVPWSFDLPDLTHRWLGIPSPSDGMRAAQDDALITGATSGQKEYYSNVYVLEEDSPSDWQFSRDWGDWSGSWSGHPSGFSQPGKIFPNGGHSYKANIHIPAAIYGNTKGALLKLSGVGGVTTGLPLSGQHLFDFDTEEWERTANKARKGGTPVLDLVTGKIIISQNLGAGASYTMNNWQLFDPLTKLFGATMTSTNSPYWGFGSTVTLAIHAPSRLMLIFAGCDAGGNTVTSSPVKQRLYGADVDAVLAGNFAFTSMTLDNPGGTWPVVSWYNQFTWELCPLDGCYYAVNGQHGSTKMWKVTPPSSNWLTSAWTVSEVNMTVGSLYAKNSSGAGTGCDIYNRLKWDPLAEGFLWFSDDPNGPVQIMRPTGV